MGKVIRLILTFLVHVLTAVQVYLLSLMFVSPLLLLVVTVFDYYQSELLKGKIIPVWLVISGALWIPLFIRTMILSHKKIK
jgi:hypothetical protein